MLSALRQIHPVLRSVMLAIAIFLIGIVLLVAYLLLIAESYPQRCRAAGGDHSYNDTVRNTGWQCWNTKTGQRIILRGK